MANIKGTNLSASIVPFTTDDQFATHCAKYGQGGWQEVATIADRNAITAQRREAGMAVYVVATGKIYVLANDLTTWNELELGAIDDVRVDGTSVVTNKIANIDLTGKVDKTTASSRVYGTDRQGNQTTYDVDSFGKVDDVKVNGESVVENKVAIVSVPTKVSQLQNDSNFQDSLEVQAAINTHNVDTTAHQDIRDSIVAATEFTADTIVPTTTNFVPGTTYSVEQAFQRTANLFGGTQGEIDDINALIPNQATTQNQLADKAFVNATVATNSANFRGNWATWDDVPTTANGYPEDYSGSRTPTNNDYMVVEDASDYTGDTQLGLTITSTDITTADGAIDVVVPNDRTYHYVNANLSNADYIEIGDTEFYIKRGSDNGVPTYEISSSYPMKIDGTVYSVGTIFTWRVTEQFTNKEVNIVFVHTGAWRFIFVGEWTIGGRNNWQPAYRIGTAFTAAQQAAIDSGITSTMVDDYVDPNSVASTAYNTRITALETDKVDKIYTAEKIYGTDSIGAQIGYVAGDNIDLSNGVINVVGVQQQIFVMPEATEERLGQIVQYMGEDTLRYTHGVMYQCVPVYGNWIATYTGTGTLTDLQLDTATFLASSEYIEGQTRYVFTCVRGGLRQQWETPSGRTTNYLREYGMTYSGRAVADDTITVTSSIIGYTWEAYAGVSSGNDKIDIVGDKVYGVNVVPQYTRNTIPAPTESNAGMICQYRGSGSLMDLYRDGYFYQVSEDMRMRDFDLEANPNKYSSLYVSDWMALEDFMQYETEDVTFYYVTAGQSMSMHNGWLIRNSMLQEPTDDLSGYGISYTLADGEELQDGDEITVHILKSYYWKNIQVQDLDFIVDYIPNADEDNWGRVIFYIGNDMLVPDGEYPVSKWYRCEQVYDEELEDWYFKWVLLPDQISLLQKEELLNDTNDVLDGQCVEYTGEDGVEYSNQLQTITLRKGHIYRAVIKYPDDEDFKSVNYYDVHPYQFDSMPAPEANYEGVVAQYTGDTDMLYTMGHFYKCVATGEMTPPSSMSKPSEEGFSFVIDATVLETQVQDPSEPFTFNFQSQGPGYQWLVQTGPNRWTTCTLSDYGITVVGEAPYGAQVKVKYIEPQDEYEWHELSISGDTIQYEELPEIDEEDVGRIVQYIGPTDMEFINGYFYQAMTEMVPSYLNYYTSSSSFTATLDVETFENYVQPTGDMDLVFTYHANNDTWLLRGGDLPVAVVITDYGVTITGTPNDGDRLELFYTAEYPDYWWEGKDVQNNGQQYELPEITYHDVGRIIQYTGETNPNYTNGYFYKGHIGINQTSSTMGNDLSIVDEETFADQVFSTEESVSGKVDSIGFSVQQGLNTQWMLSFYDENGNEIGATTTNPDLAQFEETFGLSISGTVTTSTTAEADVLFYWDRIDVQPAGGGGATVVYNPTTEELTIS